MTRLPLVLTVLALVLCAAGGAAPAGFTVPYDLEPAPNGDLYIADGESGKVLRLDGRTQKLSLYATFPTPEITSIARTRDGTLYVGEIQTGWIWKVTPKRKKSRFVRVAAPAESVLHGSTLYVASLERGIYAINLKTKRSRVFPMDPGPHGLDVDAAGNVYAARSDIVRLNPRTGRYTVVSPHDAFKPLLAPDGTLYYVNGSPTGAYVDRVDLATGTLSTVVRSPGS